MDSSPNRSPNCSPNVKTLAIAAGLFTVITLAQFFAAVAANSTALLADCVSMGIDAISFVLSMLTELFPCASPRHQAFAQLTSAFISLVLLTSFTTLFFLDAWEVTFAQEAFDTSCCDVPSTLAQVEADFAAANSGADSLIAADCLLVGGACEAAVASFDPAAPLWENAPLCAGSAASPQLDSGGPACTWSGVDPRVVFAFALFGLVFDVASLFTFRYWTDPEEMEEAEAVNMGPLRSSHGRRPPPVSSASSRPLAVVRLRLSAPRLRLPALHHHPRPLPAHLRQPRPALLPV
mmetsp:Transcript_7224/g.23159  ORF Transcript_7224/g.23159 Transcript_7224/m.23159 type:complete len:293 (+) Transcript_7224:108-986(+)